MLVNFCFKLKILFFFCFKQLQTANFDDRLSKTISFQTRVRNSFASGKEIDIPNNWVVRFVLNYYYFIIASECYHRIGPLKMSQTVLRADKFEKTMMHIEKRSDQISRSYQELSNLRFSFFVCCVVPLWWCQCV